MFLHPPPVRARDKNRNQCHKFTVRCTDVHTSCSCTCHPPLQAAHPRCWACHGYQKIEDEEVSLLVKFGGRRWLCRRSVACACVFFPPFFRRRSCTPVRRRSASQSSQESVDSMFEHDEPSTKRGCSGGVPFFLFVCFLVCFLQGYFVSCLL